VTKLLLRILFFPLAALALGAAVQFWHPDGLWRGDDDAPMDSPEESASP
jgi:hypothetical protein